MNYRNFRFHLIIFIVLSTVVISCHDGPRKTEKGEAKTSAPAEEHGGVDLKSILEYSADNGDKMNDSTVLTYRKLEDSIYSNNGYTYLWSDKEHWLRPADSLFIFIAKCKEYGLFPSDYHNTSLEFFQRILREDTLARKNIGIWSRADLMLTDAFPNPRETSQTGSPGL